MVNGTARENHIEPVWEGGEFGKVWKTFCFRPSFCSGAFFRRSMEENRGETSLPAQIARKSLPRSRADAGAEAEIEFGGDDAAVSPTQLQDEVLRLFDALELRTHKIPDEEWASTAKARAEKIRFGGEKHIMWWDADGARYPLEHVRLKADTGVHDFRIDSQVCENLRLFVADPRNYDDDGYLKA